MTWQEELKKQLKATLRTHENLSHLTKTIALKHKQTNNAYQYVPDRDYLVELSKQIEAITGKVWDYDTRHSKDIRKKMIEVFKEKAKDKKSGLTGVTFAIYREMLYNVNGNMVYWGGVERLAENTMFDRKTVYTHLKKLQTNALIEYEEMGFHIYRNGYGKTTQIRLLD